MVDEYTFQTLEECQNKLKEIQENNEVVSYSIITNYRVNTDKIFQAYDYVLVLGILSDKIN